MTANPAPYRRRVYVPPPLPERFNPITGRRIRPTCNMRLVSPQEPLLPPHLAWGKPCRYMVDISSRRRLRARFWFLSKSRGDPKQHYDERPYLAWILVYPGNTAADVKPYLLLVDVTMLDPWDVKDRRSNVVMPAEMPDWATPKNVASSF